MSTAESEPGITTGQRRAIRIFPVVFAVLVWALSTVSVPAYLFLLREYMVVEDLQFVCYLGASVLAALVAHRLWRAGTGRSVTDPIARRLAVLYGVGALGLFFVAGEEVSWGEELWERILPFYPDKEQMRALGNKQGETTLHNMGSVNHLFAYMLFAIAVYGVLSPLLKPVLHRRGVAMPRWGDYLVLPRVTIPALVIAAGYFIVSWVVLDPGHVVVPGSGEQEFRRYQEVAELYTSFSLLLFTWFRLQVTPPARDVLTTGQRWVSMRRTSRR